MKSLTKNRWFKFVVFLCLSTSLFLFNPADLSAVFCPGVDFGGGGSSGGGESGGGSDTTSGGSTGGGGGSGGGGSSDPGGGSSGGGGGPAGGGGGGSGDSDGENDYSSPPDPAAEAASAARGEAAGAARDSAEARGEINAANAAANATSASGLNNTADRGGLQSNATLIGDPVLVSTGRYVLEIEDYQIPGSSFSISRLYKSEETTIGSKGAGWLASVDSRIIRGVTRVDEVKLARAEELAAGILARYQRINKQFAEAAAIAEEMYREIYIPLLVSIEELRQTKALGLELALLNRFSKFLGTPEYYENTGNGKLVLINESGVPRVFEAAGTGVWIPVNYPERLYERLESLNGGAAYSQAGFVLSGRGGRQSFYDGFGLLIGVTELNGNHVELVRDANGRITKILGPHKNEWHISFNGEFINRISGPEGTEVRYGYKGNELVWVADWEGDRPSFVYERGRLTEIIKPDGSSIQLIYGLEGPGGRLLVTETIHEEGASESFNYNLSQRLTTYINHSGVMSRYWYDEKHRTVREEHSDGTVKTFAFNVMNQLKRETLNGFETAFSYDRRGNKAEKTYSDGSRESWEWNIKDQPTRHIDRDNVVTEWVYDSRWNIIEKRRGGQVIFTIRYDNQNRFLSSREGDREELSYEHDSRGFISGSTIMINRQEIRETWQRDAFGRILQYIDGEGRVWEYQYNGKETIEITPSGLKRRYLHNNRKTIIQITETDTKTGEERVQRFSYDRRRLLTEIVDGAGNKTKYQYRADGELIKIEQGPWYWLFEYETGGRISSVSRGKTGTNTRFTERFGYSRHGWFEEQTITIPGSGRTVFRLDPWGRVIVLTNALGESFSRTLNGAGNPLREQSASGGFYTYRYDAQGRPFQAGREGERHVQVRYNRDGTAAEKTDRLGNITRYVYDGRGLLSREITALGEQRYFYDRAGRLVRQETASRNSVTYRTEWQYNDAQRTVTVIAGGLYSETFYLNAWDEVIRFINGEGNETRYEYDGAGRRIKSIDGYGNKTRYTWNELGMISLITYADNTAEFYTYDHLGNLTEVTDALGIIWTGVYDEAGRLVKEISRPGINREYSYDALGRITEVKNGGELVERYRYNNRGRELVFTDGSSGNFFQNKNAFGELVEERNRMGDTQRFAYNAEGQLTGINAYSGRQIRLEYQTAAGITKISYADGTQSIIERDLLGNIVRVTNETGTIRYRYDAGGRLVEQFDEGAGELTRYSYDRAGRRARMLSGNRDVSYRYGRNGELLRLTDQSQRLEVSFEYDSRGRETRRIFGNGVRQETFYDVIGRTILIREMDSQNRLLRAEAYLYDEAGRRSHSVNEEGLVTKYEYDGQSRISTVLYPWTREKAETARIEAEKAGLFFTPDRGNGERYSFDLSELTVLRENLNRIFAFRGNALNVSQLMWRESFTYDKNGNRSSKTSPWGTIVYEYDAENRVTRKGDVQFINDKDGNSLAEIGLRHEAIYRYNGQNRMVYSEIIDHTNRTRISSLYAYDALGRRVMTENITGQIMRTLYDGQSFEVIREGESFSDGSFTTRHAPGGSFSNTQSNQVTGERYRWISDGSSARTRSVDGYATQESRFALRAVTLYGKGEAIAMNYSSGPSSRFMYLGKDIMGSVRSVSINAGILDARYEYDVFGQPYKGKLSGGMNLGYTGKPFDTVTGLYNYGYRDYKPRLARFTTVDPIRDGNNWFVYVNNDPVNWIDHEGLFKNVVAGTVIGAVVGGISGGVSEAALGGSARDVLGGVVSGAISGGTTGALVASGAGVVTVVGGSFVGGAAGSVAGDIAANNGTSGLNAQNVATNAAIGGVTSAVSAGAGAVVNKAGTNAVNNAWSSAASQNTTMNGSWGSAALNAHNTQQNVAAAKPVVEESLNFGLGLLGSSASNSANNARSGSNGKKAD